MRENRIMRAVWMLRWRAIDLTAETTDYLRQLVFILISKYKEALFWSIFVLRNMCNERWKLTTGRNWKYSGFRISSELKRTFSADSKCRGWALIGLFMCLCFMLGIILLFGLILFPDWQLSPACNISVHHSWIISSPKQSSNIWKYKVVCSYKYLILVIVYYQKTCRSFVLLNAEIHLHNKIYLPEFS